MAVGGRLAVDRAAQIEPADDGRRAEVKAVAHELRELLVGHLAGAVGLDEDGDRMGHADGVGQLQLAGVGQTGRNEVLGDVAGHVRAAAVDLRRVLAGEGTAAVGRVAAVGVDDDLAAGETGVTGRAADDEAAGRVHVVFRILVEQTGGEVRLDDGLDSFLLDSIPQIIETGIQLLTSLVTALPEIITAIVEAIPKIIDGIINAVLNAIPLIIQAGIDLLISLIQALPQIITTIVQAIPQIISGIVNALVGNIDKIIMAGVQLFVALIENLPTIIVEIVKAVPQIIAGIVKAFGSLMYKIVEIGGNIVKGLWSGITQLASWLWDKVSGWISSIWDGICDFFGIHSPSKEMAWVGEMLVKGLSGSIEDNGDEAVKAAEGMAEDINGVMGDLAHDMQTALPTDFDVNGSIRSAVDGVVGRAASAFTIALNITNFNNYSSEDIRQLTNEVMETANQFAQRKGVVFA